MRGMGTSSRRCPARIPVRWLSGRCPMSRFTMIHHSATAHSTAQFMLTGAGANHMVKQATAQTGATGHKHHRDCNKNPPR